MDVSQWSRAEPLKHRSGTTPSRRHPKERLRPARRVGASARRRGGRLARGSEKGAKYRVGEASSGLLLALARASKAARVWRRGGRRCFVGPSHAWRAHPPEAGGRSSPARVGESIWMRCRNVNGEPIDGLAYQRPPQEPLRARYSSAHASGTERALRGDRSAQLWATGAVLRALRFEVATTIREYQRRGRDSNPRL